MLYKYRTLHNFENVLDIIINQRLYAATFESMNDPMEGFYNLSENVGADDLEALESLMGQLKICSLTPHKNHPLMWTHYADGARGVAIGVAVTEDVNSVVYDSVSYLTADKKSNIERAKKILTYKAGWWKYEDEARVFVENSSYIDVVVKEVIFGEKINPDQKSLLEKIISSVNPTIKLISWDNSMMYAYSEPVYSKEQLEKLGPVNLITEVEV
jgi:hypothetical protein